MRKSILRGLMAFALLAGSTTMAKADVANVPLSFTHHGLIWDGDELASGNISITATIYDGEGNAIKTVTKEVTVENGFYNLTIDELSLDAILAAKDKLELGLKIGDDEMAAHIPISSVPFAIRAAHADSASTAANLSCDHCVTEDLLSGDINLKLANSGNSSGEMVIPNGSINNEKIDFNYAASNAKGGPATELAAEVVTTNTIKELAVTSTKLANGAVTKDKLGDSSVDSAKISDGTVELADLHVDSVNSAKIVDGSITADDLGADSVITAKILDKNVTNAKLADNAVTTDKIANGTITNDDIKNGTIGYGKVVASEFLNKMYPVGSIYISTALKTAAEVASALGGGTWEAYAAGRVLVGVGTSDQSFTIGTNSGSSTTSYTPVGTVGGHTLTVAEIPSHNHSFTGSAATITVKGGDHTHGPGTLTGKYYGRDNDNSGETVFGAQMDNYSAYDTWAKDGSVVINGGKTAASGSLTLTGSYTPAGSIGNKGGGGSHNHSFTGTSAKISTLQPYIVVYMWRRKA